MRTRIQELAEEAFDESSVTDREARAFAELIIQETFNWVIDNVGLMEERQWVAVKRHFGIK